MKIKLHGHRANNTAKLSPVRQSVAGNYNPGLNCLLWTSLPVFYLMQWSSSVKPIKFTVKALIPADVGVTNRQPSTDSDWFLAWKWGCLFVWPEVRSADVIASISLAIVGDRNKSIQTNLTMFAEAVGLIVFLVAVFVASTIWQNRHLPPGPFPLPVLGNLLSISLDQPYRGVDINANFAFKYVYR